MCASRYVRSPSAAKAKKGEATGAGRSGGAKTSKMPAAAQTSSPAEAKGKKKGRAAAAAAVAPSASALPGPKRPKKGAAAAVPIKVGAARARGGDALEAHGRRADAAERARGGAASSDSELSDSDWPIKVPNVRSAPCHRPYC